MAAAPEVNVWSPKCHTASVRHSPSWPDCDGTASPPPCILDAPINAESFLAWVEQFVMPTLRPGDIVVMGQSEQPQKPSDTPRDPGGRRQAVLFAALQSGPKPDRTGVRQAQDAASQGKCAQLRAGSSRHRPSPQSHHP